jgi:hypothetical protein
VYFAEGHNAGGDLTSESWNKDDNEACASGRSNKNAIFLIMSISIILQEV